MAYSCGRHQVFNGGGLVASGSDRFNGHLRSDQRTVTVDVGKLDSTYRWYFSHGHYTAGLIALHISLAQ
ncbi:hypothetical protein N7478_007370 [Penicillium angulare]|uniref:uncharacterized protein n=1 Tax=Penicillium angulare TaxID=116970 RepID=UPI002541CE7C|nr:uncharacterized protein N7478_007370 [Penicillium angulare]KAJ5281998.1 hypothetical protein N7478_007370 [Penicillium angulare]